MPITLGSNIAALISQRKLADGTAALAKTFERLSSGQRINRASDDAAGLAIADSLHAGSRIFKQGVRNLNDNLSLLSIADSAIENLSSIVMRLEELAAQAANGVYTNRQRKAMDDEAQSLSREFFRISKATEFNGQKLLSGNVQSVDLQAGVGAGAVLSAGVGGAIGTGTFASPTAHSAGAFPSAVSRGDFNCDGILDLVTTDYNNATVNVLLGLGNGAFATRMSYSVGANPRSVTTGDFNNDGHLDLVTADHNSDTASVLLGVGNGTFGASRSFSVGSNPHSVSTADLNGDGFLDFVTAELGTDTLSIALGLGNGLFAPSTSHSAGNDPRTVVTADFNGDGLVDLVTAGGSAGAGAVRISLGNGNGTFVRNVSYSVGFTAESVTAGDFNGDGVLDLATSDSFTAQVKVLLGVGNGTFGAPVADSQTGIAVRGISSGDFNGDGFLDIVALNGGSINVLIGAGNGTFGARTSFTVGANLRSSALGDFNGDGVLDFVASEGATSTANVFFGQTKDGVAPLLPFSLKKLSDARQALPVFQRKREQLAAQRGGIGAFQSRIEVARSVLEVSSENFKAAESRIRDADIADESSRLVRLNILQQAAASVLAQANQQPALALQLLKGLEQF